MSKLATSHPPKMHDKGKAHAMQVAALEISISALSTDPLHALRGQKHCASEDVIVHSSSEVDEDEDEESSGEEVGFISYILHASSACRGAFTAQEKGPS